MDQINSSNHMIYWIYSKHRMGGRGTQMGWVTTFRTGSKWCGRQMKAGTPLSACVVGKRARLRLDTGGEGSRKKVTGTTCLLGKMRGRNPWPVRLLNSCGIICVSGQTVCTAVKDDAEMLKDGQPTDDATIGLKVAWSVLYDRSSPPFCQKERPCCPVPLNVRHISQVANLLIT